MDARPSGSLERSPPIPPLRHMDAAALVLFAGAASYLPGRDCFVSAGSWLGMAPGRRPSPGRLLPVTPNIPIAHDERYP